MVTVEKLYELYNVIADSKDKKSHEAEFKLILTGVKGDVGARKITAQFISRYFSTFPELENDSLDALFDLCEDDDSTIRRQSITSLGVVCKGKEKLVPKVADILAQLLQVDDSAEINCVNASLVSLLRISAKGALTGLFYQLSNNPSEVIKDRILRFLLAKIPALTGDVFTKEIQCFIFTEATKVIPVASITELELLMQVLNETSVCRTSSAQIKLHDTLMERIDLTKPLEISPEHIVKTITILTICKKFYGSRMNSSTATNYVLSQVLPHLEAIEAALLVTGKPEDAAVMLTLLQLIASLIPSAEKIEEPKKAMDHVLKALLTLLPVPPATGAPGWEAEGGANLQFSRVECLLYSLQQLVKSAADFFEEEALKDLRQRLTYFSRGCQAYQKVLRDSIKDKKGDELKTEESKTKLMALKTTANITSIVKDFFHNPPACKSTITLSWVVEEEHKPVAVKRVAEISTEEAPAKKSRQIYAPPRDKFSRGGSYNSTFRGGRGGRARGGARGGRGFRRY